MLPTSGVVDPMQPTCSGRVAAGSELRCQLVRASAGYRQRIRSKWCLGFASRTRVACNATEPGSPDICTGRPHDVSKDRAQDVFAAAAVRLQNLLSGVGDGEDELLDSILNDEPAENKLTLSIVAGGFVASLALFICWLSGADPYGGAGLNADTAAAAALGLAAGLPLAGTQAWVWSEAGRTAFPPLEELTAGKMRFWEPIIGNMTDAQTAVVASAEVFPTLLMVLPAAQGGLTLSLTTYAAVLREMGWPLPEVLPAALALALTAALSALAEAAELSVSDEEYDQIRDSLENADRYYRLMAMGREGRLGDATAAATAFKAVAVTWLARRTLAARVAALLVAGEVVYLGLLWKQTGNLAAPAVAAVAAAVVEFRCLTQRLRAARGDGSGGGDARG